jgi:hypothetical protein
VDYGYYITFRRVLRWEEVTTALHRALEQGRELNPAGQLWKLTEVISGWRVLQVREVSFTLRYLSRRAPDEQDADFGGG